MTVLRTIFVCVVFVGLFGVANADKHAFIVGIGDYNALTDLKKTKADARGYADVFSEIGYNVTLLDDDPTWADFIVAWDTFETQIAPGDEVAFVFSGHGWSNGAENYLAFSDAPRAAPEALLEAQTIALSTKILQDLRSRKPGLIFAVIDACRNNPFDTLTMNSDYRKGLTRTQMSKGELIVFSAGANQTALDRLSDQDPEEHSVFSRSLLPRLTNATRSLAEIVDETTREVESAAMSVRHQQRPEMMLAIDLDECLSKPCTPRDRQLPADTREWLRITGEIAGLRDTCDDYRAFTELYPQSQFLTHANLVMSNNLCGLVRTSAVENTSSCSNLNQSFTVYFEFDRSQVNEFGAVSIIQAMDSVNARPECQISSLRIAGHTDRTGSFAYNEQLSFRMASSVRDVFTNLGVPDEAILLEARGESEPAIETADGVREQLNRRVEVKMLFD